MSSESYKKWYEANKEAARASKRENMRKYRAANPIKHNALSIEARRRERALLHEMYGHVCARCGFDDKRALTLDHIKNNGNVERAELGERGVYRKAKAKYQPDQYQILCMNCQFIKRIEAKRVNQHRPYDEGALRADAPQGNLFETPIVAARARQILMEAA